MEITSMAKVMQKGYDITVELEITIPTEQFGNHKPRLSTTVSGFEDVPATLKLFRKILATENIETKNTYKGE